MLNEFQLLWSDTQKKKDEWLKFALEVDISARSIAWIGFFSLFGYDSQKRKIGVEVNFALANLAEIRLVPGEKESQGFPDAISVGVVPAKVLQSQSSDLLLSRIVLLLDHRADVFICYPRVSSVCVRLLPCVVPDSCPVSFNLFFANRVEIMWAKPFLRFMWSIDAVLRYIG